MTDDVTEVDVVVAGAGFAGLYMVHKFAEADLSVLGLEAGEGVGGTWFWNRYPGARTDSLHHIYCYSFSPELAQDWTWSERYPSQPEVLRYLEHVADRFDLRKYFRFNNRVVSADYDDGVNRWVIRTEAGLTVKAKFFVPAVGLLSAPNTPPFKGLRDYRGEWYHTARWPEGGVHFTGKRVAVIGTGSTGIQIVPEAAQSAAHLTVFQRTANYVVPAQNRPVSEVESERIKQRYRAIFDKIRQHPFAMDFQSPGRNALDVSEEERQKIYEEAWAKGGFHFLFEAFDDLAVDERANETAQDFIRGKIRAIVDSPETAELLCPDDHPYASKRPPSGTNYYETFNRKNVHLVDVKSNPIAELTATGLRTESGQTWKFDVIVFATGFDASTGSLTRIDITGRGGTKLVDKWANGPLTNLGLSTAGFPNMLMITGPLSPFANIPVCVEENVEWISRCIDHILDNNIATIEATEEAEAAWAAHATDVAVNHMLAGRGEKANTWFAGANIDGKAHAINVYFGGADTYVQNCKDSEVNGYEGFTLLS